MTPEEIKNRVSALLESDRISTADNAVIDKMYYEVFRRYVRECNCPNRYRDALVEIAIYIKHHPTMEKSRYILKAGVVIVPSNDTEVYTNDNLTDAVAEAFLKERPGAVGLFAVIPEPRPESESPANAPETGKDAGTEAAAPEPEKESAEEVEKEQETESPEPVKEPEPEKESEQAPEVEKPVDEKPVEEEKPAAPAGLNPEVYAAIKARLENGETKSAIIADYVGMEVDGKALTKYGVEKYFAAIKNA